MRISQLSILLIHMRFLYEDLSAINIIDEHQIDEYSIIDEHQIDDIRKRITVYLSIISTIAFECRFRMHLLTLIKKFHQYDKFQKAASESLNDELEENQT